MIHHIVMFKITEFDDETDRIRQIEELRSILKQILKQSEYRKLRKMLLDKKV